MYSFVHAVLICVGYTLHIMQSISVPITHLGPMHWLDSMAEEFRSVYGCWINAAAKHRTYFSAIGQVLIRDLVLPYCCDVGTVPVARCAGSPALDCAAKQFPQYRVHDATAKYAILRAESSPNIILVNYASTNESFRYIALLGGETARAVSHNVLEIHSIATNHIQLLYVGDKLMMINFAYPNKPRCAWGAHGVVMGDVYYDFRVPLLFMA